MPIIAIDAHVHIWDRSCGETFIAEKQFPALIGKSFLPEDLDPMLADTHADTAVLVHGPATVKHALHCLDLCRRYQLFRSVVGWVDLRDRDCSKQLEEQSGDAAFRGVRFTPLLDADPEGYLRSEAAMQICGTLQDQGCLVEVLAPPPLYKAVAALASAHPELPVVLAHFGLPDGDPRQFDNWRAAMAPLSRFPNIHVKLSGLPFEGMAKQDRALTIRHVNAMLDLFDIERLLYASNWPVATALSTPGRWRDLLDEALGAAGVGDEPQAAIFRGNASRLY